MFDEVTDVRVFFRLFAADQRHRRDQHDVPLEARFGRQSGSPLADSNNVTIPMFAMDNLPNQTDYVDGGANTATIEIPTRLNGVYHYYGYFLNVYDPTNLINSQPISALLPSTHNCLMVQSAYDDAPIPHGASPD
jgi:hypothetical protein